MPSKLDWLAHGYVVPLAGALTWIFVLPPALRWISSYHQLNINKAKSAIYSMTEQQVLSEEEAVQLRALVVNQRAAWLTEKTETVRSLENLVEAVRLRDVTIAELQQATKEQDKKISILESPPPIAVKAVSALSVEDKAAAIGLVLKKTASAPETSVRFNQRFVEWPWKPNLSRIEPTFTFALAGAIVPREVVQAMMLLGAATSMSPRNFADRLRKNGIEDPAQCIQHMEMLQVLGTLHGDCALTAAGEAALDWLTKLGFTTPPPLPQT